MSDKILKFPKYYLYDYDEKEEFVEAYIKTEKWRVKTVETVEKRLLTIIQQRDELGTKVTMMRFHTLLNHVLESLKSE